MNKGFTLVGRRARPQSQGDSYGGQGFTLVELIVVVTIIILVTAVGVVSFTGINKRSRDSRRISDLKKVSIALEIYRQEMGSYPAALSSLVSDYMDAVPTDPKDFSYYYNRTSLYTYTYDAQVEDISLVTEGSPYSNHCGGPCNYRVTNP